MKIAVRILGRNHNEVTDNAEAMAREFAGDLPYVVKYGEGWTEQFDTRQGPTRSFARPDDFEIRFVVPIIIEVGDEPEAEETDE